MAKYGSTFVFDKQTGRGLLKVMNPMHDNITKFYISGVPEFSSVEEYEAGIVSRMPIAKASALTPEAKQQAVDEEIDIARIHTLMANDFLEYPERREEFADLLGDDPNTAFTTFGKKYGYIV